MASKNGLLWQIKWIYKQPHYFTNWQFQLTRNWIVRSKTLFTSQCTTRAFIENHGLQQLVAFPTHESNTLDLVSTNRPSPILNIHSSAGISDHDIICFEVSAKVESTKQIPRSIYMYNKANWNALKEEFITLLISDYNDTSEGTNVD